MKYKITRRDFLNGVAIGTGASLLAPAELFAQAVSGGSSVYYPPTLTGMRGNHPGSFEVSHALAWSGVKPAEYRKLDEHYDMVIVGAGVSGLAAARFYQKRMGPDAKVLLLEVALRLPGSTRSGWDPMRKSCYWIIMTTSAGIASATSFTMVDGCCWASAAR